MTSGAFDAVGRTPQNGLPADHAAPQRFHFQASLAMEHPHTILYTRRGCHLCAEAKNVLFRHGLVPREVDIDTDPSLVAQFDQCVPVVTIDGKTRFRGRIDEVLLRRLLAGRKP